MGTDSCCDDEDLYNTLTERGNAMGAEARHDRCKRFRSGLCWWGDEIGKSDSRALLVYGCTLVVITIWDIGTLGTCGGEIHARLPCVFLSTKETEQVGIAEISMDDANAWSCLTL